MTATTTEHLNGVNTGALQQMMDDIKADPRKGVAKFHATTAWKGHGPRSETRIAGWELGGRKLPRNFTLNVDEPAELLGANSAANPQEYLFAAMNSCMLATYVAAASMQGIRLKSLEIESEGELDLRGFLGLDKKVSPGYDRIRYTVRIAGDGTKQQFEAVHNWVKATSPNYFNMANAITLDSKLVVH